MPSLTEFWSEVPLDQPLFVHPEDWPVLELLNDNPLEQPPLDHHTYPGYGPAQEPGFLHLSLVPEPFTGDLNNADVFILQANPGFAGTEYEEQNTNLNFRQRLVATIRQELGGFQHRHAYFDPAFEGYAGYSWWTAHLPQLANNQEQSDRLATIDLFPYHSNQFRHHSLLGDLPSVQVARDYVRCELVPRAKNGEITIVVTRQRKNWGFTLREDNGENIVVYRGGEVLGAWMGPNTRGGLAIAQILEL